MREGGSGVSLARAEAMDGAAPESNHAATLANAVFWAIGLPSRETSGSRGRKGKRRDRAEVPAAALRERLRASLLLAMRLVIC